MNTRQFVCDHGHAYYDGDEGLGDPYQDGRHDALHHIRDEGVSSWDPWEREAYERGFLHGQEEKDGRARYMS